MTTQHPNVYIIILCYNGWRDTIECLESVFRISYPHYRVIVVDNCSSDDSWEHLKGWADAERNTWRCDCVELQNLFEKPLEKPIPYLLINREGLTCPGGSTSTPPLVLIQTGANLGYAGGNNVGIQYAINQGDYDYIWLVNNDTVVDGYALDALIHYCRQHAEAGIVGSKLMYYHKPKTIQSMGGKINRWFATTSVLGRDQEDIGQWQDIEVDHIQGASFFISKRCIETTGLLPEDYFMYMEETDYCYHARLNGFKVVTTHLSKVFHKEGSSTGCQPEKGKVGKSYFADTLSIRNRLRFAKKYLRPYLPTVFLGLFISLLIRIKRHQWRNAVYVLRLIFGIES